MTASGKLVQDRYPKTKSDVDHVLTNTHPSQGESQLYIFEDNEAVIKMIIKGRSPTMRHVSRTHRAALDWLFDRINLDQKSKSVYIDFSKHQLADLFTKGNFTRDEWNNLLLLFNIGHVSSNCCTKNFSLVSCSTLAKRMQNQKDWARVASKSRQQWWICLLSIATSSSTTSSPIASTSPGTSGASVRDLGWHWKKKIISKGRSTFWIILIAFPQTSSLSHQEALLFVFEDNEAAIKMIIKGRSPTMRRVSRTHRVALDWLFDRINVEPKIQIQHVDTKNQLADM